MDNQLIGALIGAGATVFATVFAIVISNKYYKHSQRLEQDRMMKELFREFNERFDRINHRLLVLSKFTESEIEALSAVDRLEWEAVVMDFFNISSEEYFWNQKERLDPKIWDSWSRGMNEIYDKSFFIQQLWTSECENEGYKSYYLKARNELFRRA